MTFTRVATRGNRAPESTLSEDKNMIQTASKAEKRTKLTNSDKRALADALFQQIETIILGAEEKNGYYQALEELDAVAMRLQMEKWINRLP